MQNQVPQNTPRPCFDKNATLQARDEDQLHYALAQMCGAPENSPQAPMAYDQHDIVVALAFAGVTTFWGAFLTLTEDDIMSLELPPDPANPHQGHSSVNRHDESRARAHYANRYKLKLTTTKTPIE